MKKTIHKWTVCMEDYLEESDMDHMNYSGEPTIITGEGRKIILKDFNSNSKSNWSLEEKFDGEEEKQNGIDYSTLEDGLVATRV